jgi:hypothetical protein
MIGRRYRRPLLAGLACAVLPATGCKLFDRSGTDRPGRYARDDRPDPLLGGVKIPPTDLPIPGKDAYGKERRDPLLGSPTGRDDRTSRTTRDPFRTGPETTVAGLTGRLTPGDEAPGIGDRREPVIPAGGVPLTRPAPTSTAKLDDVTAELKRFGGTWTEPVKESGEYLFRVDVPVEGGADGAVRRYQGSGASAAAAAADALAQIKTDRGL